MIAILTLFCIAAVTAAPAQGLVFTTLASFNGTNGANPLLMSLVQGTDGNFYGTTQQGGANNSCQGGCGTVFKITSAGVLTSLYSFCSQPNCTDGSAPYAGLVQGTEGNFYGTTYAGGANNVGTVFQITPAGALTTLHSFAGPDGADPWAALTRANDGDFYGTTIVGGANSLGTVFKITSSGALTTLYSFQGGSDAANPVSGLVQARDGNFYGTTLSQSSDHPCYAFIYGCGTIFQITPAGELTSLYSFCTQPNCPDGNQPYGGLVQATDGNFYGTTYGGGNYDYNDCPNNGCGTLFKVTSSGVLTTLYLFDGSGGSDPTGTMVQARDGNLYGTSSGDDDWQGHGTIFRITESGALTTLHLFDSYYTAEPYGGLVQAGDGSFYGTTYAGGDYGFGTVFRLGYSASVRPCAVCRQ